MGQDLSLTLVWTTRSDEELDWEAGRRAVSALTRQEIDEHGYHEDETLETAWALILDDLEAVETEWRAQAASFREAVSEDDRALRRVARSDVAMLRTGPVRTLITGGMSSGDDPTDFYEVLDGVPDSVYEAVGFFS